MKSKILGWVLVAFTMLSAGMLIFPETAFAADPVPSGQVWLVENKVVLEPAYNDFDGSLMYLQTPYLTPLVDHTNARAEAPLYVVVYPTSVGNAIGPMNCQHFPMDNCPDHGPAIAGAAEFLEPAVYGPAVDGTTGVWGHDHIGGKPPANPNGTDYNVAWEPVLVLFTSQEAAATHITTLVQLQAAVKAGQVIEVPNPGAVFQCASVSASVYKNGTPVTPAPPAP